MVKNNAPPQGAGMTDYLKEAFLFRWNLLFLLGGTTAAAMTPLAPVLLPLVAAGEITYLTGLVSIPRFRAAIDVRIEPGQSTDLRAYLRSGNKALTETWTYPWISA